MGLNKVMLLGNLGKDPEIKRLESGVVKASFSLATSETYKNKAGEKITTTQWHNLVVWRGLAEIAEKYLIKGSQILAEGKITYREYEDKEGVKKRFTEIIVDNFTMVGNKKHHDDEEAPPERRGAPEQPDLKDMPEDDLPF